MDYKLENSRIILQGKLPKPKKITGTRFAGISGLDNWKTPFETWCALTKFYEEPFLGNKYTEAGKAIEPIAINYLEKLFWSENVVRATDIYGENPFKSTYGNFFKDKSEIFGGMWDAKLADKKTGEITTVVEVKTTKRIEDWEQDVPNNYLCQGTLYADLDEIENILFMVCFLTDEDYVNPEAFIPTSENTKFISKKLSELREDFDVHKANAIQFWNDHVLTGISPEITSKDKELMKEIGKVNVQADMGITAIINEADEIMEELAKTKPLEDRLKDIKDLIKLDMTKNLTGNKTSAIIEGTQTIWTLSTSSRKGIDKKAMKKDGILEKYETTTESTTLRNKKREEETNG